MCTHTHTCTCMLRHCRCTLSCAHVYGCNDCVVTHMNHHHALTHSLFLTHVASSLCVASYRLDSLWRNSIGPEGAVALAEMLKHNTALEQLL